MKISGDDGLSDEDYKLTPSEGKSEILSIWPTYSLKIFLKTTKCKYLGKKLQINM